MVFLGFHWGVIEHVAAAETGTPSDEKVRHLDSFVQPSRWVTGELTLQQAAEPLAEGRPTLHARIDVDHTMPENVPVGWPRMYLNLEPEEKGWEGFEWFEFLVQGRTSHPKPSGMFAVFQVMCPDKNTGAGVAIRIPKPNAWTRVSIPIQSINNLRRLGSILFYIGEKRYEHGEKVEFFIGDFRLVGSDSSPGKHAVRHAQVNTLDTYVLDDLESLDGWAVLKDAKLEASDSAAKGNGAMRVQFPGTVRKKLRSRPLEELLIWGQCQGLSFWAQGDGSEMFGSVSAQGWSGRLSYVYYFPLKDTDWRKFTVAWSEFAPQGQFEPIGARGGMSPGGGIDSITLGDRWSIYHNNAALPPFGFSIDQIQIEQCVEQPASVPELRPLPDVLRKLKARQPVHIVCIGDSITAGAALSDPNSQRYAVLLQSILRKRLEYDGIRVESRGVGGARTTDARAWVARDFLGPAPDLVTILFGYNDKKSYTRDYFKRSLDDYLNRIARETEGKTAVLLLTTIPGTGPAFALLGGFADAVRELAEERNVAVFDLHRAVKSAGTRGEIESQYFADMGHPNEKGQQLIAKCIADFLYTSMKVVRIDFGTHDSPVRKGYLRVTRNMRFREGSRAGWVETGGLTDLDRPIPRGPSQPIIYTTDWRQDAVQGRGSATLRVAVPRGRYRVWVMAGPGGGPRAQVWDVQIQSGSSSTRATYFGENACRAMTMDVECTESGNLHLNISTRSTWSLNSMVVASLAEWPEIRTEEISKLEQEAFLLPDDVLKNWKHTPHEDDTPAPEYTKAERARGFVIHQKPWLTPVWPNTVPRQERFDPTLETFAARDDYEPLTFTVLPLRDFDSAMVSVSDLRTEDGHVIPASDIVVRYVLYKWVRPSYNVHDTYYRAPDLLPRLETPQPLQANENFRVWLTVYARADAPAGVYRGTSILTLEGQPAAEVPIVFRVLPITLEKDQSVRYGTYYKHPSRYISKAPDPFSHQWWSRKLEQDFASMAAHGYNAYVAAISAHRSEDGRWQTGLGDLESQLDMARGYGFQVDGPIVCRFSYPLGKRYRHYMGKDIPTHLYGIRMPPREFFDDVTELVRAFEAERKQRGLPEILYYPIDEPSRTPASMQFMTAIFEAVKKVPDVRVYVTADPADPGFAPLKPYVDVWCCHVFSLPREERDADKRERGVEHWCYPNRIAGENDHTPVAGARMTYGFGRWRMGYPALLPWTFEGFSGAPENYLDGYMMDFFNHTADDASVLPCTLYEAYREGIDDGRYVTTLENWIERAREAGYGKEADEAAADLDSLRESIAVNRRRYGEIESWGWKADRLDVNRWKLAERIVALQEKQEGSKVES